MKENTDSELNEVECCSNCKHCVDEETNNRYRDIKHFCLITGYYLHGANKDRNKIERFSPGGKKLECRYEKRDNN